METRRVQRIKIELKGKVEVPEETEKKVVVLKGMPFKTRDISLSGALLIVTHYLPKGIKVNLVFSEDKKAQLPGFTISTEIIYCKFAAIKTYKLGVRFRGLGEEKKKFIQNLLNKYR